MAFIGSWIASVKISYAGVFNTVQSEIIIDITFLVVIIVGANGVDFANFADRGRGATSSLF